MYVALNFPSSILIIERNIKLMLASKSHNAQRFLRIPIVQGMLKLHRFSWFGGSLLCMITLNLSDKFTICRLKCFFLFRIYFNILHTLGFVEVPQRMVLLKYISLYFPHSFFLYSHFFILLY